MPNRESNKTAGAKGAARQDVSRYRELREAMGWSRETAAAELGMSDDKLERIENGRQMPNPQDVLVMSRVYQAPALCNYFCHNECEIGQMYVPEVPDSELPNIVLGLLDSVNNVADIDKILIKITADDLIEDHEIPDLVNIQDTLEKLSIMIEALQLCIERKVSRGEISRDLYEKEMRKK